MAVYAEHLDTTGKRLCLARSQTIAIIQAVSMKEGDPENNESFKCWLHSEILVLGLEISKGMRSSSTVPTYALADGGNL